MQAKLAEEHPKVGLVIIGRNEGERFVACLASLPKDIPAIYVDSGSTDSSVANAEAAGVYVAILSSNVGFTAARARNLGWHSLIHISPDLDFIQFIDGDCSLDSGWLDKARFAIEQNDKLAVVFGRRRERYPERSLYNAQCDREWDVPIGQALSCGGDAFMRRAALDQVSGYHDNLIAGEEPDLCLRMRSLGWEICRIDAEMTLHDAAILTFGGWWQRARRAGHAYAEHVFIHRRSAIPSWSRAVASMLVWALLLPCSIIVSLIFGFVSTPLWFFVLLAVGALYMFQFVRLSRKTKDMGFSAEASRAEAFLMIMAKFAHLAGAATFVLNFVRGKRAVLMEYK